jgi:hypothetical protein
MDVGDCQFSDRASGSAETDRKVRAVLGSDAGVVASLSTDKAATWTPAPARAVRARWKARSSGRWAVIVP